MISSSFHLFSSVFGIRVKWAHTQAQSRAIAQSKQTFMRRHNMNSICWTPSHRASRIVSLMLFERCNRIQCRNKTIRIAFERFLPQMTTRARAYIDNKKWLFTISVFVHCVHEWYWIVSILLVELSFDDCSSPALLRRPHPLLWLSVSLIILGILQMFSFRFEVEVLFARWTMNQTKQVPTNIQP